MNNVSKLKPKPSTLDIIGQIADAIRPTFKAPANKMSDADPTPAELKTTAELIGRADMRNILALHNYARTLVNSGEILHQSAEQAATWALLYVTQGRLNFLPALTWNDLRCRLQYFAEAEADDVWPDGCKIEGLEQAQRDVRLLSHNNIELAKEEADRWYTDGEPRRHGWHDAAEAAE